MKKNVFKPKNKKNKKTEKNEKQINKTDKSTTKKTLHNSGAPWNPQSFPQIQNYFGKT